MENEQADAGRDGIILNPSRDTKFSGAYEDRGIIIFPVQLTTRRVGNHTRLVHSLIYVMTLHTKQNKDKRHDELGLQLNSSHWVKDRMGVDEENIQVMDVEIVMGDCPITIPTVHTYK